MGDLICTEPNRKPDPNSIVQQRIYCANDECEELLESTNTKLSKK